jgi:AraC-like DNA-binding protein
MAVTQSLRLRTYEREKISWAADYIQSHLSLKLDAKTVAAVAGLSAYKLKAGFPVVTGKAFALFVREARLQKAQSLLQESNILVSEVARQCGYQNEASFYRAFKQWTGKTPDRYRV